MNRKVRRHSSDGVRLAVSVTIAWGAVLSHAGANELFQLQPINTASSQHAATADCSQTPRDGRANRKMMLQGKCGEGKCGVTNLHEGKCGEGKCGAAIRRQQDRCADANQD